MESTEGTSLKNIVVLDTNVLLADPNSILSFPRAEVIIPETVLGELDKLKTARVDPDLRFRGREVSRILFELGEDASLIDGVDLPDGGRLRVASLDSDRGLPEGLSTRQADDKILATAMQVCSASAPDCEVLLVTNDLNMLLKAQTLGIKVTRHGDGTEGGFMRRFVIRPFQRYKVPIAILAIAIAVFAAILVIVFTTRTATTSVTLPTEFKQLLSDTQQSAFDNLTTLQQRPKDPEALLGMATYYYGLTEQARIANDRSSQLRWSQPGIRYYQRYLAIQSGDADSRADYATLLFYAGQTDKAIQEIGKVLEGQPNHLNANYNLGVILMSGRNDLSGAREQLTKAIELAGNNQDAHAIKAQAQLLLQQIDAQEKATTETTKGAVQ